MGGAGGTGGTIGAAGGGAAGMAAGGAGAAGMPAGGAGGAAAGAGGAGGAGGATGGGGAGGAAQAFCETQTPKTLPFELTARAGGMGVYVPSGWFGMMADMTDVGCPVGPVTFPGVDAGAGAADAGADAGSSDDDAGAAPDFNFCLGVRYDTDDTADDFAGINWDVPVGGMAACFENVTAVEFWAAGNGTVNFEAHASGTQTPIALTSTWTLYRIDITADLNTTGVDHAFTIGFSDMVSGTDPVFAYVADPTFVGD